MTIYLQRSASMQPRTSLGKSDVSWQWIYNLWAGGRIPERRSGMGDVTTLAKDLSHEAETWRRAAIATNPSPRHITLSEARSRLYRRRFLQPNSHFAAFFKIYKIFTILRRSNLKILQNFIKNFVILKKKS